MPRRSNTSHNEKLGQGISRRKPVAPGNPIPSVSALSYADVLIITPLKEERQAVLRQLGKYHLLPPSDADTRIYHHAVLRIGGKNQATETTMSVIVAQPSGMARVEAAVLAKDAVRRFRPRYVLLVGIAGGTGDGVNLGDILIANQIVDYEIKKLTPKGPTHRDQVFRAGSRLLQAAQHLSGWQKRIKVKRPEPGSSVVHVGTVASGDKVVATRTALQPIIKRWPKLVGVEMEGGGVADALDSEEPKPEMLMIRGVSDKADHAKGTPDVEQWRPYACTAAAVFAVELLRSGLLPVAVATALGTGSGPRTAERPTKKGPPDRGAYSPSGSASPMDSLLLGMTPLSLSEQIRSLLIYYLGTPTSPVPFGGRGESIAKLDQWLTADNPSCLLLTAPAGRGKSALLAQWAARLAADTKVSVAYFPISIRFGTQQAQAILGALCGRLALLHGDPAPDPASGLTYGELRAQFTHMLRRAVPQGRQLVIIIDGLDEASNLDTDTTLFPVPPTGLRIVVSAREGTGGRTDQDYCYSLGWDRRRVSLLQLPLLDDLNGIATILASAGMNTETLTPKQRSSLLLQFLRLSEGEPLLVRFLIDEIHERADSVSHVAAYLKNIEPGFPGLMKRWWTKQKGSNEEQALLEYQRLIDVLAAAYGAMQRADLHALLGDLLSSEHRLDDGLTALGRFVVEDTSHHGFVFSHSKLRDYFLGALTPTEEQSLDARFIRYGEQVVARLASGLLQPDLVPRYLLHHLGAHIARAGHGCAHYMSLVAKAWHDAWVAAGSEFGFLSDVLLAFDAVSAFDTLAVDSHKPPQLLLDELRCALTAATVRGRAGNISSALLEALLVSRKWSPSHALAHLRNADAQHHSIHRDEHIAASLKILAPRLSRDLLREATELALPYVKRQHEDLLPMVALIPRLVEVDPEFLFGVLSELKPEKRLPLHLEAIKSSSGICRARHLAEAEQACDELSEYPWAQARWYEDLTRIDADRKERLFPKILQAAERIPKLDGRIRHLSSLYIFWADPKIAKSLTDAFALVPQSRLSELELFGILFDGLKLPALQFEAILRAMEGEEAAPEAIVHLYTGGNISQEERSQLLSSVAAQWSQSRRQGVVNLALTEISATIWPHGLRRLITLVQQLGSEKDQEEALERVNRLRKAPTKVYGRALLGAILPASERLAALMEVFVQIKDESWQRNCVAGLWPHLTEDEASTVCKALLSDAHPALRRDLARHLAAQEDTSQEERRNLNEIVAKADEELREKLPEWKLLLVRANASYSTDPTSARESLMRGIELGMKEADASSVGMQLEWQLLSASQSGTGSAYAREVWRKLRPFYEQDLRRFSASSLDDAVEKLSADVRSEYVELALVYARSRHDHRLLLALMPYVQVAEGDRLLDEALVNARRLRDGYEQIVLCAALARTEDAQHEILRSIQTQFSHADHRVGLLRLLGQQAVPALLPVICDAVIGEIEQLPEHCPDRLSWTSHIADWLDPKRRAYHVSRSLEIAFHIHDQNREIMAAPADGMFPNDTPKTRTNEIQALVHSLPRLAKYLETAQVREAMSFFPERPAFLVSRLELALCLPEADMAAHLRLEYERLCALDADDPLRPGSLAMVVARMPVSERAAAAEFVLTPIEQIQLQDQKPHDHQIRCLKFLAPALGVQHCDRVYRLLVAAISSVGSLSVFSALLAAMPAPLRALLATRLLSHSTRLSPDVQDRLRAQLVAVVSPAEREVPLQAAARHPEPSVLTALGSAADQLSDQQLQWITQELHEVQSQQSVGNDFLGPLTTLILALRQRGLPWERLGYQSVHATLRKYHQHPRAGLLQSLASQGQLLSALVSLSGDDCQSPPPWDHPSPRIRDQGKTSRNRNGIYTPS